MRKYFAVNPSPRLMLLVVKRQGTGRLGSGLACSAFLSWLCGITQQNLLLAPLMAAFAPLIMASVIGTSFYSPMRILEETVAIVLLPFQLGYAIGLCGVTVVMLLLPTYLVSGSIPWYLLGIFIGEVGLVLVGHRLLGAARSWVVPLVYVTATYFVFVTEYHDLNNASLSAWMWPIGLIVTLDSLLCQVGLLLIGVVSLIASDGDSVVPDTLS